MSSVGDGTVDLVVTSPPYPMIEMWDAAFGGADPIVEEALIAGEGKRAFDRMHDELDGVWRECKRVLRPGGFLCINVGDATRSVDDEFRLYSNHSRIISSCESIGFRSLPLILWRKQTNAPNKFMGSGMLPSGAYVTLEHEYLLVFRNGPKRTFNRDEAVRRRRSAFFWEERNSWFSDLWELKGVRQLLPSNAARSRSAAFPLELVNRVVNMYSLQEDTVLDPYLGTGTTSAAALLNGRNSIGYEMHEELAPVIRHSLHTIAGMANRQVAQRLDSHIAFVKEYAGRAGKKMGHTNAFYGFPVMTKQEREIRLPGLDSLVEEETLRFVGDHSDAPLDADRYASQTTMEESQPWLEWGK